MLGPRGRAALDAEGGVWSREGRGRRAAGGRVQRFSADFLQVPRELTHRPGGGRLRPPPGPQLCPPVGALVGPRAQRAVLHCTHVWAPASLPGQLRPAPPGGEARQGRSVGTVACEEASVPSGPWTSGLFAHSNFFFIDQT